MHSAHEPSKVESSRHVWIKQEPIHVMSDQYCDFMRLHITKICATSAVLHVVQITFHWQVDHIECYAYIAITSLAETFVHI